MNFSFLTKTIQCDLLNKLWEVLGEGSIKKARNRVSRLKFGLQGKDMGLEA